ncbi:hypothetical protein BS50DRAFT_491615 [Corynespora cassiicola Philippines]|uniref:Actin-like ATPase domain-containing protein n=1 Tax=Corynespora cassiicola Philippines TaxID=1448308 RepID=A0A2T2NSA0_CORCC|nr:hypothetical protein BS50DRAFT_491615 [Corynespora cassiicola Philippines]
MIEKPDLVVSIDFGMTCTGVAYCNVATGSTNVRHIQKWPGRLNANENKVPTLLMYRKGSQAPSSWGFDAETLLDNDFDDEYAELFKTYLDDEKREEARVNSRNPEDVPPTMEVVEKWYTDYFRCLYRTIEQRLSGELASTWEDAKIEFIFSVPTTWRPDPPDTVERFRKIVREAGFGESRSHTAVIGLTEAEAAAVHTARSAPGIFKENEILIVCDVGGGTTDLSAFRVNKANGPAGSLSLNQIDVVFGATIGAVQLDSCFQESVRSKLELANRARPMGLDDLVTTAWKMRSRREYQNAKCGYGTKESLSDTETFSVVIPNLDRTYRNDQYGIRGGNMIFKREELKPFFDTQVNQLFDLIDKQLSRLQGKFPGEQASHMILSGGLGNSAYVLSRLRQRYTSGNSHHPNARTLQIRVAPDTQLVVCKGNVADRVAKITSGHSVLDQRCCRTSYGTLCKVLYDPKNPKHVGQKTEIDHMDGRAYVMNWIDWFIKQGQAVSSDEPIQRNFQRKCSPATAMNPDPPRVFPTEIVSCDLESVMLPDSDFSSIPLQNFKLKNRHWWNMGAKYHRVNFCVKVLIGPADICFELWHQNVKLSRDHAIKVEWHAVAPSPPRTRPVDNHFSEGLGEGKTFVPGANGGAGVFGRRVVVG